jgi:indolepyruvate ferredoxin oxidoreductase beta subunit
VLSPSIAPGTADIMVGFEVAEALRWCHYLRPEGVAMVNTLQLAPPVVSVGLFEYPDDPVGKMREAGVKDHLPFPAEHLRERILERFRARKPEAVPINEQAFEAGRQAA